jgi:hypothetical protein
MGTIIGDKNEELALNDTMKPCVHGSLPLVHRRYKINVEHAIVRSDYGEGVRGPSCGTVVIWCHYQERKYHF